MNNILRYLFIPTSGFNIPMLASHSKNLIPIHTSLLAARLLICTLILIISPSVHASNIKKETKKNSYLCSFMAAPPLTATDWANSNLLENKSLKETRFKDYNGKKDIDPLRQTSFYMAYNTEGWYIYIYSKEPKMKDIISKGLPGGSLELFLMPGREKVAYFQFIINLATGHIEFYEWDVPHRYYRPLKGSMKSETIALKDGWGTFIFIPWECLYDKLPLNEESWRFSVMRWMPNLKPRSPSLTWGGKVHQTGEWGSIKWGALSEKERMAIKRNIVKKALNSYQRMSRKLTKKWNDKNFGDQPFYNSNVKPLIEKYNKSAKEMDDIAILPKGKIEEIYKDLRKWMELKYEVGELRETYLKNKLKTRAK